MRTRPLILCGALLAVSAAYAQLKVDVAFVDVVATVTDDRGRYVSGLTADDFVLEEDGKTQTIARISEDDDLPVSVGILLDISASMEKKISTATTAVERFVRTIHKDDDIFLMTFADMPRIRQDFTSDRSKLTKALKGIKLEYGTALYDALDEGLIHMKRGKHPKKAVLLITDGVDQGSHQNTYSQVLEDVRRSEMLVYCLGIAPSSSGPLSGQPPGGIPTGGRTPGPGGTQRTPAITLPGGISIPIPGIGGRFPLAPLGPQRGGFPGGNPGADIDMQVLDAFADASGGRAWLVSPTNSDRRDDSLDRVFDQIAAELRSQYTIGFYPQRPINDGKWHRVELRTKNSRYHVRSRKDYFDGAQDERR